MSGSVPNGYKSRVIGYGGKGELRSFLDEIGNLTYYLCIALVYEQQKIQLEYIFVYGLMMLRHTLTYYFL